LQSDQRAKATGASHLGAMRKPIIRVACRANFGDFDLFDARPFEQELIGIPQVKVDLAVVRFKQSL